MLAELESGLKRLPTIEECTALAEERDIALPVCLLDARPYDLRHTFASVGAGGGLSLPIIGKLLGHTQARTTQRYAHLADDALKEATKTIGAVISGAGKPSAELLTIKGRLHAFAPARVRSSISGRRRCWRCYSKNRMA
jgi:Phage integrase family